MRRATADGGHLFLAYLIAMVAMLFTALSYGAMAGAFPRAGSTYTFTRNGLSPHLGLLSGWRSRSTTCCSRPQHDPPRVVRQRPVAVDPLLVVVVAAVMSSHSSTCVSALACQDLRGAAAGLAGGDRVVHRRRRAHPQRRDGGGHRLFNEADLQRCQLPLEPAVRRHAVACFSFLGFDAISTLAEETKRPARAVSIATVSSLLLITGLFLVQVYFSALLVPNANKLTNPNTAFYQIFGVAGGSTLSTVLTVALIAACLANAIASLGGASRLLYGMGRDGVIPKKVFGYSGRSHRRQFSTSC